ncbi:MAG: dTDP-4-dehydrorhamnose 3,5-epimerase [Saprospiraceae bacterium]|nr:dTDP-4-dehydrorhamnose 3,5-epimerase [Saprospiraceae bacterium]
MNVIKTEFDGLFVFEPRVFEDDRGYFFESYNNRLLAEHGINTLFVQDNESRSQLGTLRGLHYQISPFGQAKLVRVTSGEVIDIVVDLRKDQPTYGKSFRIQLSAENKKQMLVPRGFAHGFLCMSENTTFNYKCDNYYSKEHEGCINAFDPVLDLDWCLAHSDIIRSQKDIEAPQWGSHIPFQK